MRHASGRTGPTRFCVENLDQLWRDGKAVDRIQAVQITKRFGADHKRRIAKRHVQQRL
tara:strand:- start:202 stop:375 length:174 start_codon:yes stop_codon:yes gene_type:complete